VLLLSNQVSRETVKAPESSDHGVEWAVEESLKSRSLRATQLDLASQVIALVCDLASAALAFYLAYQVRYGLEVGGVILPADREPFQTFLRPLLVSVVLVLLIFSLRGMYRFRRASSLLDDLLRVSGGFTTVMAGVVLLAFFLRFAPSRLVFLYAWMLGILFMIGHRMLARYARRLLWKRGIGVDRVLVVGEGQTGRRIMQAISSSPQLGFQLAGFAGGNDPGERINVATERGVRSLPRLGGAADVPGIVARHDIDEVIILPGNGSQSSVLDIVQQCRDSVVRFRLVPDVLQFSLDRVQLSEIGGVPIIGIKDASIRGWNAFWKRSIDVVTACAVLVLASIPMLFVALVIRRDTPGPVLYRQTRIGKDGNPFTMLKFRCMVRNADEMWADLLSVTAEADARLFKIKVDPRMTRSGRWLRRYSLDELPQFLHVLTGEMSVIGPRPPLPLEVEAYDEWHHQRLLVKPGMTGLWQVNGRSALSFDEMVRLDLYYAENWSPWMDIKIMLRTLPAVILGRGAY
jgi:exopolysaccharide biosynthesis polyprenyl glycosylphosphotransferase